MRLNVDRNTKREHLATFDHSAEHTADEKRQKVKGAVSSVPIQTRKEFTNGHLFSLTVQPDTDVEAKLFIHAAFFPGFEGHFRELRAALESSSERIVLCQQSSSAGSMFRIKEVHKQHGTEPSPNMTHPRSELYTWAVCCQQRRGNHHGRHTDLPPLQREAEVEALKHEEFKETH